MDTDLFDGPGQLGQDTEEIPRDRWGRPLVVPPGGGKPIPYTRCTTYVGAMEDNYNLARWQQRMVALGLADRPDLVLAAAAHRDSKDKLNEICAGALDASQARAKAEIGTALHKFTEPIDRGQLPGNVPEAYRADLDAYQQATAWLEIVGIERFTVQDELKIGGTHDRTVRYQGRDYIADIKTGGIEYGALKIAQQLAVYAHSVLYDPRTHERTPLDVDQEWALVIHLPAGEGRCELHWIDIAAGWEAVQVSTQVRAWRSRRNLYKPFTTSIPDQIATAATVDALYALHRANTAAWTDEFTQLAAARKRVLLGGQS